MFGMNGTFNLPLSSAGTVGRESAKIFLSKETSKVRPESPSRKGLWPRRVGKGTKGRD